jgi:hypothetical protein
MGEVTKLPARISNGVTAIVPRDMDEVGRLATGIAKSGLAPQGMNKPEQIMVAILHGLEVGLPPMQAVQRIAVINGRPAIWGDAVPAILWSKGFQIKEWSESGTAYCTVTRPDGSTVTRQFTVDEAKRAGLWGRKGPWTQYPERMLQMRARGFACRDAAADALSGMYVVEEVQDGYIPEIEIPKRKSAYAAKKDGTDEIFAEIKGQIADAETLEKLEQIPALYHDELQEMPSGWVQLLNDEFADRHAELDPT